MVHNNHVHVCMHVSAIFITLGVLTAEHELQTAAKLISLGIACKQEALQQQAVEQRAQLTHQSMVRWWFLAQ